MISPFHIGGACTHISDVHDESLDLPHQAVPLGAVLLRDRHGERDSRGSKTRRLSTKQPRQANKRPAHSKQIISLQKHENTQSHASIEGVMSAET